MNSTVMFGALALHALGQEVSPAPERAGRPKVDWAQHERASSDYYRTSPGTAGMSPTARPSVSPKSVSADNGTSKSAPREPIKGTPQPGQSPSIKEGTGKNAEEPSVSYAGGDGSSLEKAIIIKAPDEVAGLNAEHTYISIHFGKYETVMQGLDLKKERRFDMITFKTSDGKKHILYFDITAFYGMGFEPSKDN